MACGAGRADGRACDAQAGRPLRTRAADWQDASRHGRQDENRPFTDQEVARLLAGDAPQDLRNAMIIAALSGLRLGEIYTLRVADCRDGVFDIRQGKTPAAVRRVPIHSRLADTVRRLSDGKAGTDYLMPAKGGADESRAHSAATRFIDHRRSLGIEEMRGGGRSRVNFHSFRRWFRTKAVQAGKQPYVVDQVTGHALQGLTLSVYHGGDTEEALRACAEAVRLPEAV